MGIVSPDSAFKQGIVHHVSGAFMMTKISLFKQVGMFDENTFLYNEEDILSERGRIKGLKFYFSATVTVIHERGGTTSQVFSTLEQQKIGFRSAVYYYKSYCNTSNGILLLAKLNFFCIFAPLLWIKEHFYKVLYGE